MRAPTAAPAATPAAVDPTAATPASPVPPAPAPAPGDGTRGPEVGGRRPPSRWWPRVRMALSLGLVVAAFVGVLPRVASYGDAWDHLAAARPLHLALLVALAAANLVSYWPLLVASLPGLTLRNAAVANQVSTAVANTVPAGGAWGAGVTVSLYRRWGHRPEAIARSLVVTGIWNAGTKLVLALAAVALTVAHRGPAPRALAVTSSLALAALVVATALAVRRPAVLRAVAAGAERLVAPVARRLGRTPATGWADAADRLRRDAGELLARRWPALTATALVSHLSLFAVLAAALHATGVEGVGLVESFAAFAVVRVALLVPLTPGGAGLAEVGLSALLTAAGGAAAAIVAAVLVFRAVTWGMPVVVGGLCWLLELRRRAREPGGEEASREGRAS